MKDIIEKLRLYSESKHPLLWHYRVTLEKKWSAIEAMMVRQDDLKRAMEDKKEDIKGIEHTIAKMKDEITAEQEKISAAEYEIQKHSISVSEFKAEAYQRKAYGVEYEQTTQQADREQAYVEKMNAAVRRSRLNITDLKKAVDGQEEKHKNKIESLERDKAQVESLQNEMSEKREEYQILADRAEIAMEQSEAAEHLTGNKDVSALDYPLAWINNNIVTAKPFAWIDNGLDRNAIHKFIDDELAKFRSGGTILEFIEENDNPGDKPYSYKGCLQLEFARADVALIAGQTLQDGERILEREFMNGSRWRRLACGKMFPERLFMALSEKDNDTFPKDYTPEQIVRDLAEIDVQKPVPEVLPKEEYPVVSVASPIGLENFVPAPVPTGDWFGKNAKYGIAFVCLLVALLVALFCVF